MAREGGRGIDSKVLETVGLPPLLRISLELNKYGTTRRIAITDGHRSRKGTLNEFKKLKKGCLISEREDSTNGTILDDFFDNADKKEIAALLSGADFVNLRGFYYKKIKDVAESLKEFGTKETPIRYMEYRVAGRGRY